MYGLNAVAFVFFISINLFAYQLCKYSEASRKKVLSALCVTLLFSNIIRYVVVYPFIEGAMRIPVEFFTGGVLCSTNDIADRKKKHAELGGVFGADGGLLLLHSYGCCGWAIV